MSPELAVVLVGVVVMVAVLLVTLELPMTAN